MDEFNEKFNRRPREIHPDQYCPNLVFSGPLTGKEIKDKVKAYRDLYGTTPEIAIRGIFRILDANGKPLMGDGDLLHADIDKAMIWSLGNVNATVEIQGQRVRIRLNSADYWPGNPGFKSMTLFTI